jgi:hypothetical protein
MPRPYHSPSSIKLAQRCERKWAECYLNGRRDPSTPATELGTAGHIVLEDWYEGRDPEWESFPGQVMHAGIHLLPHPEQCASVLVEQPIGDIPYDNPDEHGPQWVLEIDGVRWAGFRDLLAVPTEAEAARLGVPPGRMTLFDYKTSSNIKRYALTEAELRADLQCNLYAYATMVDWKRDEVHARWVYFETKAVRRAHAVDALIDHADALAVIEPCNTLARHLDTITDVAATVKNPLACNDYGRTCIHHKSVGGPCDARRSIGSLVQARNPKKDTYTMALTQEQKDRFAKIKGGTAAAPPPAADAPADANDDTATDDADVEAPAATKPTPPAKRTAAAPPAAGAKPSKLLALAAKYEAKQAELAAIGAEIAAFVS